MCQSLLPVDASTSLVDIETLAVELGRIVVR